MKLVAVKLWWSVVMYIRTPLSLLNEILHNQLLCSLLFQARISKLLIRSASKACLLETMLPICCGGEESQVIGSFRNLTWLSLSLFRLAVPLRQQSRHPHPFEVFWIHVDASSLRIIEKRTFCK